MTDPVPPIPAFMQQMGETIIKTAGNLDPEEMAAFFREMLALKKLDSCESDTPRAYVAGAGRSGFIAKAFALRLMHLGLDAYVVGETITPAFKRGDTLIVFSGSGETHSIVSVCETAKELGGRVCLITAVPESRMRELADCVVNLGDLTGTYRHEKSSFEARQLTGKYRSTTSAFAPLGTLFETLALVFSDAVISSLVVAKKAGIDDMERRATNVE
jgi:6-phospho-3-hexuloisomerase